MILVGFSTQFQIDHVKVPLGLRRQMGLKVPIWMDNSFQNTAILDLKMASKLPTDVKKAIG